jgi:hypothetical protein
MTVISIYYYTDWSQIKKDFKRLQGLASLSISGLLHPMPKRCLADTDPLPPPQQLFCAGQRCGIYIADKRTDFSWGKNSQGTLVPQPFLTCQKCRDKSRIKREEAKELKVRESAVDEDERLAKEEDDSLEHELLAIKVLSFPGFRPCPFPCVGCDVLTIVLCAVGASGCGGEVEVRARRRRPSFARRPSFS